MSKIKTKDDIDFVMNDFINDSTINIDQAEPLKKMVIELVNHPELETFYNTNDTVYNERDIITKEGLILRPDRVVVNIKNEAVIIDYKTGAEDKKHAQQLQLYQDILQDMKITVKKKILVYMNDDISVKEV